jgi:glycosyltransferase involved in cell wall biosynthesis
MFAPEGAPERYAETTIIGLSSFAFPLYPELRLVPPGFNVEKELNEFGPDIVLLVNPALLGLVGLRHARALDLPVVAAYCTDMPYYTEKYGLGWFKDPVVAYFRWIHNQADLNLCPSHFTRQQLEAWGFERLKLWRRGVDSERFNPGYRSQEWRERLSGGHPDAPLLVYVGRLGIEKRIDMMRPVLDALPQARFAIVGDGPNREELKTLFAGTNTVFTGFLQGQDLSHAYASGDVFCFPSASETFGNVVLEAMASGLPVVVTRSGGQVDHVRQGFNGLLFPTEDQEALIEAVRCLATDLPYARELGANALAYARTQTWEIILDTLLYDLHKALTAYKRAQEHPEGAPHRRARARWPRYTDPARRPGTLFELRRPDEPEPKNLDPEREGTSPRDP